MVGALTERNVADSLWALAKLQLSLGDKFPHSFVVKLARQLPPGSTIVTVLCDGGHRSLSKLYSPPFLESRGLAPTGTGAALSFVQ